MKSLSQDHNYTLRCSPPSAGFVNPLRVCLIIRKDKISTGRETKTKSQDLLSGGIFFSDLGSGVAKKSPESLLWHYNPASTSVQACGVDQIQPQGLDEVLVQCPCPPTVLAAMPTEWSMVLGKVGRMAGLGELRARMSNKAKKTPFLWSKAPLGGDGGGVDPGAEARKAPLLLQTWNNPRVWFFLALPQSGLDARSRGLFYGSSLEPAYDCSQFPQIVPPAERVQCLAHSEVHIQARLKFAREHLDVPEEYWENVICPPLAPSSSSSRSLPPSIPNDVAAVHTPRSEAAPFPRQPRTFQTPFYKSEVFSPPPDLLKPRLRRPTIGPESVKEPINARRASPQRVDTSAPPRALWSSEEAAGASRVLLGARLASPLSLLASPCLALPSRKCA
ncbi:hypothetical protein NFI96_003974 [Prochilodus magdalenae]|nr:hypothetical protein NFI96_003974 [Prochilodus magdalenae]